MRVYGIKELDLNSISPSRPSDYNASKIVVIGHPGSGKSYLINDLLYHKSNVIPTGVVFSGTEDVNPQYSKHIPDLFIHNQLDLAALEHYIRRQRIACENIPNPWSFLLIDDCTDEPSVLSKPVFQKIFKNGRHWKMLFILSLQYALDIRPNIRNNIDGTFIFRENSRATRHKLYEHYAGLIPSENLFNQLMDQMTEDHTALYINNCGKSNNWEENVFWYRAKPVPENFRMCAPEVWAFAEERYDAEAANRNRFA